MCSDAGASGTATACHQALCTPLHACPVFPSVALQHGVRNSLLVAPMPTASTSQILGNNECFEPYTSNIYVRRVLSGEQAGEHATSWAGRGKGCAG